MSQLDFSLSYFTVSESETIRSYRTVLGEFRLKKPLRLRRGDMIRTDGPYLFVAPRVWSDDSHHDKLRGPLSMFMGTPVGRMK